MPAIAAPLRKRLPCLRPRRAHLHSRLAGDPGASPPRAQARLEVRGLHTRRGTRCAPRARRTKPSGLPSPRVLEALRCPRPELPEGCGGRVSPVCPGRRGAGTRAARRTAPTPARAAPQLWLCETRPQWCASGSRRWCEPGSTSWRRERGPAPLCLPLSSGRRAPPGPRRFPGGSGSPRPAGECAHKQGRPTRRRAGEAAATPRPRTRPAEQRRKGNRN